MHLLPYEAHVAALEPLISYPYPYFSSLSSRSFLNYHLSPYYLSSFNLISSFYP